MEHERAGRLRFRDPLDGAAGIAALRVRAPREHDGDGGLVAGAEVGLAEVTAGSRG